MRHGPASDAAEMSAFTSVSSWSRPAAAWWMVTLPSVTVSFSRLTCRGPSGVEGCSAQSTVPSSAIEMLARGRTSRMSKISSSPRISGGSSASIEKDSIVIAGSSGRVPATSTSSKRNGSSRALTSPLTVTGRPRMRPASTSKSLRNLSQWKNGGTTSAAVSASTSRPPMMTNMRASSVSPAAADACRPKMGPGFGTTTCAKKISRTSLYPRERVDKVANAPVRRFPPLFRPAMARTPFAARPHGIFKRALSARRAPPCRGS